MKISRKQIRKIINETLNEGYEVSPGTVEDLYPNWKGQMRMVFDTSIKRHYDAFSKYYKVGPEEYIERVSKIITDPKELQMVKDAIGFTGSVAISSPDGGRFVSSGMPDGRPISTGDLMALLQAGMTHDRLRVIHTGNLTAEEQRIIDNSY
jgi:hypothetical protein